METIKNLNTVFQESVLNIKKTTESSFNSFNKLPE